MCSDCNSPGGASGVDLTGAIALHITSRMSSPMLSLAIDFPLILCIISGALKITTIDLSNSTLLGCENKDKSIGNVRNSNAAAIICRSLIGPWLRPRGAERAAGLPRLRQQPGGGGGGYLKLYGQV